MNNCRLCLACGGRRVLGKYRTGERRRFESTLGAPVSTTKVFSSCSEMANQMCLTTFTRPSQDEEAKMVLSIFDQSTLNASLECSCHARIGNSCEGSDREMSLLVTSIS